MSDARKRKLQASLNKSTDLPESLKFVPSVDSPTNGPHAKKQKTLETSATTPKTFDTHLLTLQADQLLKAIRGTPTNDDNSDKLVSSIIKLIKAIPDQTALKLNDIRRVSKDCNVTIPFPVNPPEDLQLNFSYEGLESLQIAGLSSLQMRSRTSMMEAEMFLEMPSSAIQEKDYLNNRIHYKIAYYLFTVARAMKSKYELTYDTRTLFGVGQTVLVVQYKARRVVIYVVLPRNSFEDHKLSPEKNADRSIQGATPAYNASILGLTNSLALFENLGTSANASPGFRDSVLLAEKYLSKRFLAIHIDQWAVVTACLLAGGGKNGGKLLSPNASALQLFRGTVLFLSQLFQTSSGSVSFGDAQAEPGCWVRGLDLFSHVSNQEKAALGHELNLVVQYLTDNEADPIKAFEQVFLTECRYIGAWDLEIRFACQECSDAELQRMWRTLKRALEDRVTLISVSRPRRSMASSVSQTERVKPDPEIHIGMLLNRSASQATMILGPPASSPDATSFRAFWGVLSELRKFKDGRILESVVLAKVNPCIDICTKILGLHFPVLPSSKTWVIFGADTAECQSLLAQQKALAAEFNEFARIARDLEDLPLRITEISSADSIFAGCAASIPTEIDALLQFESSARWPDDLEAIQRTKVAFLLALRKPFMTIPGVIDTQVVLENQSSTTINFASTQSIINIGLLKISMTSNMTYNVRIHFNREAVLLSTYLKSAAARSDVTTKIRYQSALELYEKTYINLELHSKYVRNISMSFPAFSGAIIALKQWFRAHLLESHFSDRTLDLLGLVPFVTPYMVTPQSPLSAFYRTIQFLAQWDWRMEPLILCDNNEMRKAQGALFADLRVSNPGHSLMVYSPYECPASGVEKVAALRMTSLAKATNIALQKASAISTTMITPLHHFDLVINLKDDRKVSRYKNLDSAESKLSMPIALFKKELQDIYGHCLWFFTSAGTSTVAALVEPSLTKPRRFRPNLGYPTKAIKGHEALEVVLDLAAIIEEIQRLGRGLISSITTKPKL